jgi:hypothetical protein
MNKNFEHLWISLLDSPAFRRFSRAGLGKYLFGSKAFNYLRLFKNAITSSVEIRRYPGLFDGVRTFCLFVGHNKSGTSMVGSLLDAHPDAIVSDEERALEYVDAGFRREQLFHILLKGSRREFLKGRVTARRLTPYSYLVPGQWQGRYHRLRVIGDGAAGSSTQFFARDPELLSRLEKLMNGIDVKFIQVIRNPFDPISVMMVRGKRTFENSIEHYFTSCETLVQMRRQLDDSQLRAVHYEDFVTSPEKHLSELCNFLGLEPHSDYLQACASLMRPSPDQQRNMVQWDAHWIGVVQEKIDRYDFLQGYRFE